MHISRRAFIQTTVIGGAGLSAFGFDVGPAYAQAKTLARVVACSGTDSLPAKLDQKVVDEHCKELATLIAEYKKTWVDVATPFIGKIVSCPEFANSSTSWRVARRSLIRKPRSSVHLLQLAGAQAGG